MVKPVYQQMTLSPKLGVVEISTLWHFRLPLPIQMFIKVVSSPRLSGIGMPSPILWSHPLKMQRIVLRSSLLWWEIGTNSLITGPGEWLSFRRFTSKLSWSWSWALNLAFKFLIYPRRYSVHTWYTHSSDLVLRHWRNIYYLDMCHDRRAAALRGVFFFSVFMVPFLWVQWIPFCLFIYLYVCILCVETLSCIRYSQEECIKK